MYRLRGDAVRQVFAIILETLAQFGQKIDGDELLLDGITQLETVHDRI
jgi:hypothetical protein